MQYIGPLSRFEGFEKKTSFSNYKIIALASGPEPQRTLLETRLAESLESSAIPALLLQGKAGTPYEEHCGNLTILNHLTTAELAQLMSNADWVISRSGYSTIMDLASLGQKAILIPTPGQTEQEYLADYHREQQHYFSMKQSDFDLESALQQALSYKGISPPNSFDLRETAMQKLLREIT